jgi:hypothetical protein
MVVVLDLRNGCSYIVVIELHELHMYTVSYKVSIATHATCSIVLTIVKTF